MEKLKVKKPVRTISGVTPLTVVLKPKKCDHGTCIYCPGGEKVPQSYTDKSPAIMRALALNFDPYEQVKNRLKVLKIMNHPTGKIELIVLGGTFLQYPVEYQEEFIKRCFDALNCVDSKNLEEAKKLNESAEHRCIAMCIENRPDNCSEEEIKRMLSYGCTRVEIGVQMPDDELYKKVNRGHTVKDVIEATERLKNAGFKLGYHIMPGLPYSNPKKDLTLFKKIFEDERFRPDQLKIYPCQVIENSPLSKTYKIIKYKPYDEEQTEKLLFEMMKLIPRYCRVMRMMREFPKEKLVSGMERLDLRKEVEKDLRESREKVKEIRMREIGFNKDIDSKINLKTTKYKASNGEEYFLELVNKDNILFGLLRLRIFSERKSVNDKTKTGLTTNQNNIDDYDKGGDIKNSDKENIINSSSKSRAERGKVAIVRELHVYGQSINLGKKDIEASQHKGIGKLLMREAEKITKENGIGKLKVISGVGVKEYYRKLGYEDDGDYVVKDF
jgi:elongator complex protein 3